VLAPGSRTIVRESGLIAVQQPASHRRGDCSL
jgi:hypothetical protein